MYSSGQKKVPVLLARTTGSTSYNSRTVLRCTRSAVAVHVPVCSMIVHILLLIEVHYQDA